MRIVRRPVKDRPYSRGLPNRGDRTAASSANGGFFQRIGAKFFAQLEKGGLRFQPARVGAEIGHGFLDVVAHEKTRRTDLEQRVVVRTRRLRREIEIADGERPTF